MANIFDENPDFTSTKDIAIKLKNIYNMGIIRDTLVPINLDVQARYTFLSLNWPGNDLIRQVILDTVKLLEEHNIDLKDVKW